METDFVRDTPYPVPISTTFRFQDAIEIPASAEDSACATAISSERGCVSKWTLSSTRRAIDFGVAAAALFLFLPAMLLVAIAVRLSSPGPVLFKQQRMGRNGLVFTLYKFRSMRVMIDQSSPITVTGDNRITKIGKILRKYKLDELPQFWNVLRGDMSLVGPRPKLPHHEALHMPFRPGITGAATLAFRFEEEMLSRVPHEHLDAYYERFVKPSKANIDWEYMQSASLRKDCGILWQTAKSCISSGETQYQVQLPEFTDTMHEFVLQQTGTEPKPSFSASIV